MAYLRFVVPDRDLDSGRKQGLFQVVAELLREGDLSAHERETLDEIGAWFHSHLERPETFSRSRRPHAKAVAISWFKDSAKEHIRRMYAVASILAVHGIRAEVLTTERPGYVVYEDEWQITAEPYSETGA